jgi:flagellar hook-associated protein 3 FlgL
VRITDRLIFDSARASTAQARDAAQAAQDLVSNGTSIQHPGDDPAGAGLMVAFQMSSDRFAAIQSATAAASDELNAADGALDGVSTALSRARELAVQFANSTYTGAQRAMGAVEVGGLVQQVVSDLNTRFGNRYIFGGNEDGAPPFQSDGTYVGDAGIRQVEVAPGVYQQANVRADVAIQGVGGGTDVLKTLQALQTALTNDDVAGVQGTLDALDASINQVATARAQAGTSMSALDAASSAAKIASGDDKTQASKQGDVDLADAAIQLQATQNALQASLAAAAQSFRVSLLDYLS